MSLIWLFEKHPLPIDEIRALSGDKEAKKRLEIREKMKRDAIADSFNPDYPGQ